MGILELDLLGGLVRAGVLWGIWRVQRCTASPVNNDGLIHHGLAIPTHIWGNITTANKAQNNQACGGLCPARGEGCALWTRGQTIF